MSTLTPEDERLIRDVLDDALDEGWTRAKAKEWFSRKLDRMKYDAERRSFVADEAYARFDASDLTSDAVTPEQQSNAARLLQATGDQLAAAGWRARVRDGWPAPIAFEIERLIQELQGRVHEGDRLTPSPATALLQMRDAYEILIKVCTVVLLRALIEASGEPAEWARRKGFALTALGAWNGALREAAKRVADAPVAIPPAQALAKALSKPVLAAFDGFVEARNAEIGHGALALDPEETAGIVTKYLTGPKSLNGVLDALVRAGAFEDATLVAGEDGKERRLTGAGELQRWLSDGHAGEHKGHAIPLHLRWSDGALRLSPFITARACDKCRRTDVVVFDNKDRKGSIFHLLDYARGHKFSRKAALVPDLAAEHDAAGLADLDPPLLEPGASLNDQRVAEALDRARVDRNYIPPAYLRRPFAGWLASRDRGIYWLQAPAHVGKTTFVQGLLEPGLDDEPIDPRWERGGPGRVLGYYCRRDYRTGLGGFVNTLDARLRTTLSVSTGLDEPPPDFRPLLGAPSGADFVAWLDAWRAYAARYRLLAAPDAPLLLAIDGLDEADPPGGSTLLSVLPREAELSAGIYLLLTSRLVGDADAPGFLDSHVALLYPEPAQ